VSAPGSSTAKRQWLKTIGENFRRQRRSAGLTQEKLAELADLAPRTIQKIEAGQLDILATTIRRLQKALRCRYDDLLG
jgi:transcriptional regulator with XRE-family HTH domain